MKYKAVLFDLDGTLIDSVDDIGDAANPNGISMLFSVNVIQFPVSRIRRALLKLRKNW